MHPRTAGVQPAYWRFNFDVVWGERSAGWEPRSSEFVSERALNPYEFAAQAFENQPTEINPTGLSSPDNGAHVRHH